MPISQGLDLPKLPRIEDVLGAGPISDRPETIYSLIRAQQPSLVPLAQQLGMQLQDLQGPVISQIREGARAAAAAQQSEAMKRGLTGSDIEAANMLQARLGGEQLVGQIVSQQGMQLAQMLFNAAGMDIEANRQMFFALAQAIGEQRAQDIQLGLEKQFLQEGQAGAKRLGAQARGGFLGGSVGTLGGAAAGGLLLAPLGPLGILLGAMLGSQVGGGAGSGFGRLAAG